MPWIVLALVLGTPANAQTAGDAPADEISSPAREGAEQLDLDPAYVQGVHEGLDLLFRGRHDEALTRFRTLDRAYPGTAIDTVGEAVMWQARMLENGDARYDAEYTVASELAHADLALAIDDPAHQGWDLFLQALVLGLDTAQAVEHADYLGAATRAVATATAVGSARTAAPDSSDLLLADGVYHFWWSVATQSTRLLPDRDDRARGIEELREVEAKGALLAPVATLSLAHAHATDGDFDAAMGASLRFARQYPDNVINNLLLGQLLDHEHRFEEAMRTYDRVLRADTENGRVRYFRGRTLSKLGRGDAAMLEFKAYLESPYLDKDQRAEGQYRLALACHQVGAYADAEQHFQRAVALSGHPEAADSLRRMQGAKAKGRIAY